MSLRRKHFIFILLLSINSSHAAVINDPFAYFNVYSLGNIGSANDRYNTDFQGVTGAAGDAYFGNFGFTNNNQSEYVFHGDGQLNMASGGFKGSVDVAGTTNLSNFHITGDLFAGSDVSLSNFSISGNLNHAGNLSMSSGSAGGTILSSFAYQPEIDFLSLNQLFRDTSSSLAQRADTGTIDYRNSGGDLHAIAASGENVFTVTAEELRKAYAFTVTGPADAVVYINVVGDGNTELMDGANWHYLGGVKNDDVIVNYTNADRINLHGSNIVNLLAPDADIYFTSGVHTGNLIAANLYGGAQVNLGGFDGPIPPTNIPEPQTLMLFLMGLAGIGFMRRRSQRTIS